MTTPALDPHTTAIAAALAAGTGLLVGDGVKPDGAGWQGEANAVFVGYVILYQLGARFDGTLAAPTRDLDGTWQTTAVGATRQQAVDVADDARTWLVDNGRGIVVSGRKIVQVTPASEGTGAVSRDDSTSPPLFFVPDRFTIRSTPT